MVWPALAQSEQPAEPPALLGTTLAFDLADLNKKHHKSDKLRGKVVILECWASWCGPCKRSIPDFLSLKSKYGDKLEVLGVSYDNTKEELKAFLKDDAVGRTITYPVIFTTSDKQPWGEITMIPTSIILDKKGVVRDYHVGYRTGEELSAVIEKLMAE